MSSRSLLSLAVLASCVPDAPPPSEHDEWDDRLADRVVDYSAALRIAALRLTGELPTLTELDAVAEPADLAAKRAAYEQLVRGYLQGPRFARQLFAFWQDTMKLGGAPELETAPAFAAQLGVADRSFIELFTATQNTCPTFDRGTGTFTPAACGNGAPATVGLLTDPGVMTQFFSNFGFRRVRWLQETFACTRFPAELAAEPIDIGAALPYTGTFPFTSIAGKDTGGSVDFLSKSSVICANCHSNINHIAPLFAHYDAQGQYHATIVVPTPAPNNPPAVMADYLPQGEPLAWRHGVWLTDMTSLGAAIVADAATSECLIARMWDWAMGKSDIVDGANRVPTDTIAAQVQAFASGGYLQRDALYQIFTSDDFVRF